MCEDLVSEKLREVEKGKKWKKGGAAERSISKAAQQTREKPASGR